MNFPPLRSLVAGVVDQTELGAVYGLLAILDAILPFICKKKDIR